MSHLCEHIPMQHGLIYLANLDLLLSISTSSYWLYILFMDMLSNMNQPGQNELYDLMKKYMFLTVISIQITMFGIEVYLFKLIRISTYSFHYEKLLQWLQIQWALFVVAIIGVFCDIFANTLDGTSGILLLKPAFRIYEVFFVTKFMRHLQETGEQISELPEVFNQIA